MLSIQFLSTLVMSLFMSACQLSQEVRQEVPTSPPAPTPVMQGGDPEPAELRGMLEAHNQYRRAVGVPPLEWSAELEQVAQEWANELKNRDCKMQHRPSSGKWDVPYGENIYWSWNLKNAPADPVHNWAEEKAYFDAGNCNFNNFTCGGETVGHYTQMVWRNTTHVGCAKASCGAEEIWVCNYNPPGNYVGQRPY